MSLEPKSPSADALKRARETAEQALAGATNPQVKAARDGAKETLRRTPAAAPARLTKGFSYVLDDLVTIPGTKIRVGLDPVFSLVPWAGTAVGALFGGVIILDAIRLRAPLSVIARMVSNAILDWLLGLIPFIGAIFDVSYRANAKNLKLLNRAIEDKELVRKASIRYWLVAAALLLVALIVIVAVPIWIILSLDALITAK